MSVSLDSLSTFVDHLRAMFPNLGALKILFAQTDGEFDEALELLLEHAADHLERNANLLGNLGEDGLTAVLIPCLNKPGVRVSQQAYTKGHVDITVEAEFGLRRRLGEAKIYDGPEYHVEGLEQLINRYSTGREGSGFVVEYVKKAKIDELVTKIRSHMDTAKPCSQKGATQAHRHINWTFISFHNHSSGEVLRVLHLSCNLYRVKE